jgi:hypothetical protein
VRWALWRALLRGVVGVRVGVVCGGLLGWDDGVWMLRRRESSLIKSRHGRRLCEGRVVGVGLVLQSVRDTSVCGGEGLSQGVR